jgi:DNA-binding beta-propeller fold protein YncE
MTSPTSLPEQAHRVRIADKRVDESSGLACSAKHPNLIYTVNDEDGPLFAIDARTGDTVGTFSVADRKLRDPEALSMGPDGMLWIADIGANRGKKKAFALHALPEPGPGDHGAVPATKYRITYPDGSRPDAEAFLVHPMTGDGYVITREASGHLYRCRTGLLDATSKNALEFVASGFPSQVTDACFTIDGRFVLLRQQGRRDTVTVLDAVSWQVVDKFRVPMLNQPEAIAADPDGKHVWIGSEGRNSPLIRVPLPALYGSGS